MRLSQITKNFETFYLYDMGRFIGTVQAPSFEVAVEVGMHRWPVGKQSTTKEENGKKIVEFF